MVATTYDISEITESLVTALKAANTASKMWVSNNGPIPNFNLNITSSSPDSVRVGQQGDCQLNLYLMHVGQNPFLRNTPILGPAALANTQQPLALDLSYLLTAFAGDNADREQQAMSIALLAFHEQPISTASGQYLTISLGRDTLEEMSRLWQSFTVAYRLSAVFRVAVALLTPSQPPGTPAPPPKTVEIAVAPAAPPLATTPQLFDVMRAINASFPAGSTDPEQVTWTAAAPPVAVAGAQLRIGGQGLSSAQASVVTLTPTDGTPPLVVTAWRTNPALDSELVLNLPATYAIPPAAAAPASLPTPGVYLLSVGGSNAIPLRIVPLFTNVASPPLLAAAAGIYTVTGAGFVPGATQVFIGAMPLQPLAAAPAAGSGGFEVSADGTSIVFALPPNQPAGQTAVRIRVDGVDAPPTWQLVAP